MAAAEAFASAATFCSRFRRTTARRCCQNQRSAGILEIAGRHRGSAPGARPVSFNSPWPAAWPWRRPRSKRTASCSTAVTGTNVSPPCSRRPRCRPGFPAAAGSRGAAGFQPAVKPALAFAASGGTLMAAPAKTASPRWTAALSPQGPNPRPAGSVTSRAKAPSSPIPGGGRSFRVRPRRHRRPGTRNPRPAGLGADAAVGILHRRPGRGLAAEFVNYGAPVDPDFILHVRGVFASGNPGPAGAPPLNLKPIRRGALTEVEVPFLEHFARVVFE